MLSLVFRAVDGGGRSKTSATTNVTDDRGFAMTNYSDGENSAKRIGTGIVPKIEVPDYGLPSENIYSKNLEENVASSSSSKLRSSFIGMGFSSSLVDKAIKENGEDNADLLLETLFAYTAPQESKSSDSLDSLFGDVDESCSHPNWITLPLKEEPDAYGAVNDKKASLLRMSFSVDEVEFALDKLGEDAPISELVDFIFAARIADNANDAVPGDAVGSQDTSTEAMFGTMEKTLVLLEMGFTEKEVSAAVEKCGSKVPISELAASIIAEQDGYTYIGTTKYFSSSSRMSNSTRSIDPPIVKTEECGFDDIDFLEKLKGKRPKEQYIDDHSLLKRPKQEYDTDSSSSFSPTLFEARLRNSISFPNPLKPVPKRKVHRKPEQLDTSGIVKIPMPISCRAHDKMVATSPYFLYGSVQSLSRNSWNKISQYLYAIQPEFVNTQSYSALSRQEGYIHNLPAENRFPLLPKPPMTIQEVINTKKWWPSWDTRKHLSFIDTATAGASELCQRLGRMLYNSKGNLSVKEQEDIVDQCRMLNLVWVGQYELAPIGPAHLERILGCPVDHTRAAGFSLTERLLSLKHCFQIDTLAYHLSGLKSLFPKGLTVLSIHSGIGGAEIALHRLGIQLRVVVSVEPLETLRRILKQWWETSGVNGELVQLESTNKIEAMINKYSGFDLVFCQDVSCGSSRSSSVPADFDFHTLCEFARILARVRHVIKKKR